MFVKICGLRTAAAVEAAVASGADALGFVFADSPRRVTPDQALALCRGLPRRVIRVAVMRHPAAAEWELVREEFAPDWLQTDAEDFAALGRLGCEPLPVYRCADRGANPSAGRSADRSADSSRGRSANRGADSSVGRSGVRWPARILFEGAQSGRGERADWLGAAQVAARTRVILAGGLDSDNIVDAIAAVQPWGVDVSSGVERSRGVKDPGKIREFIARVRAMRRKQVHVH